MKCIDYLAFQSYISQILTEIEVSEEYKLFLFQSYISQILTRVKRSKAPTPQTFQSYISQILTVNTAFLET